ncbi:MAG: cobaltochelatase subunit CobN, partial [Victivallales bacterium]
PEWIAAQQNENYAGARMIARTVDNLWGWQSVTPENIDPSQWNELYEVYQKDRYRLGLRRFFQQENAWAEQSVSARMLEAVRKEFWNAPRQIRTELARNYAQSVIDNGVACCDHTCNNPLLHQMVVNLISVPGVMTPESVAKFQIAVERAAARELSEQIRERRSRQAGLKQSPPQQESAPRRSPELHPVKGYKMKEAHDDKTRMSSSGIRWASILALLALAGVFLAGTRQEKQ